MSNAQYEVTIGLEVHVQLSTKSKIWCSCAVKTMAQVNSTVCPVCLAMPGSLPVLNRAVVEKAVLASLALNFQLNYQSFFDRKNYFYPDLPKGYQITQFFTPIAEKGFLELELEEGEKKKISLERLQIEEDTGKSQHASTGSLINLNRAGTPLIEIVSAPEIKSAQEAALYFKTLCDTLTFLGVTEGNLQEGNLRCDANVSLAEVGSKKLGTRREIKNLNSFRNVEKAIESEIKLQTEILSQGGKVKQQTLGFDANTLTIKVLREKGESSDYRYFPEPDVLPILLTEDDVSALKKKMVELPSEKRERYKSDFELSQYDASVLTQSKELALYFEEVMSLYKGKAKNAANWIMVELLRFLNEANCSPKNSPISPANLAELLLLIDSKVISGKMAKDVFEKMYDEKKSAKALVDELGLSQITSEEAIGKLIDEVIQKSPQQLSDYRNGKDRLFGFFVGQVMKLSQGKANPDLVNKILKEKL